MLVGSRGTLRWFSKTTSQEKQSACDISSQVVPSHCRGWSARGKANVLYRTTVRSRVLAHTNASETLIRWWRRCRRRHGSRRPSSHHEAVACFAHRVSLMSRCHRRNVAPRLQLHLQSRSTRSMTRHLRHHRSRTLPSTNRKTLKLNTITQ
jgi:hypothetical protein